MSKALEKIKKIAYNEKSAWLDEARVRQENKAWRKRSFQIAAHILIEIRRQKPINGMTQKMLAKKMGVAPQYINKVLKGKENFTLETIAKFEEVLGITLIHINEPKLNKEIESTEFVSSDKISGYNEVYNTYQGYLNQVILYTKEELNSQLQDIVHDETFNKNELAEKLSSYCASIKDKTFLDERFIMTYLNNLVNDLWKLKQNELPSKHDDDTAHLTCSLKDFNDMNWKIFSNIKYSDKNKYDYEG